MIYVFEQGNVVYDGNTISEEQKARAVVVEELPPKPEIPEGKMAVIRANKVEERVYWELVDIPPQPEIEELKDRLRDAEQAILELSQLLVLGGVQ